MKRPTMLATAMLKQLSIDLGLSVKRDVQTLERRCTHEGEGFLTLTLPLLSDALERGLESTQFSCPVGFSRHGSLPRFLGGFFKLVFALDGRLLPSACPFAIRGIRQFCRFFKKLKIGCSEERENLAIKAYLAVEDDLRLQTENVERDDNVLDLIARLIWSSVLPEPSTDSIVCRHGPGVTADRYLSNERNRIRKWNTRAEVSFPSDLHCYPNYGYAGENTGVGPDCNQGLDFLDVAQEDGVRVVFVPKTQSAPRVIAIEPAHVQYMQQGLMRYFVERIQSHDLTRKSLRFNDQRPNQRLAYRSSIDRKLATLDLKDASDRVHLHLVQRLFKDSGVLEYLEDSRSLHATLPNGRNVVLWKFASMGSAMCFPVEACVFYTLIQSAMHQLDGIRPTFRSIRRYSDMIDIFGDDIIVPVEYTDVVVRYLESYALKVNVNKSFRESAFRESCGADYYNGIDVKPVYARQLAPDNARDWLPEHVMAWTATADQLYMTGQWHVCQAVRDMVSEVVGRPIPRCRVTGSGISFFSFLFTTQLSYDKHLHGWRQKRIVFTNIKMKDEIDGDPIACFNRVFLHKGVEDTNVHRHPHVPEATSSHKPGYIWTDPRNEGILPCPSVEDNEESDLSEHHRSLHRLSAGLVVPEGEWGSDDSPPDGTAIQDDCSRRGGAPDWFVLTRRAVPVGIDFASSTYRGRYKSKCRWVTVSQP